MSEYTVPPEQHSATAIDEQAPPAAGSAVKDKELEMYRTLLEPPKQYRNGFTWTAVAGAIFCGLLMMPGSIYLSLITGGVITASWVTVIIFSEVSRRALKSLNTQEIVVLLYVASAMSLGGPIAQLILRQYIIQSEAVRDMGLLDKFPSWWAPLTTSDAVTHRVLMHSDWLIPILLIVFITVVGKVSSYTLGYFFFRLTSDVERLPFPMAPVSAQGSMALAESGEKKTTWKWQVFSIGAILGLIFAAVQYGIPMISGAVLAKPIWIIPQPFYDATNVTEGFLPATPTGMTIDLLLVLIGMVVPFWAVIGTAVAVVFTMVANPILHAMGVLKGWQPGMDAFNTQYANNVDFWTSFGIGVAAAIAVISIIQTVREVIKQLRVLRAQKARTSSGVAAREGLWATPPGRGDFAPWIAIVIYMACSTLIVLVCHALVPKFPVHFLFFFTLIYTPFISYVNAKIKGICGNFVEIPFVREGAFILSGYQGIEVWLAPIPVDNYGAQAESFRVTELTGTNFWSYVKADLLVVPLAFILSFVFWAFIWHVSPIPSEQFPFAQKMWAFNVKNQLIWWSATMPHAGGESLFMKSMHPNVIGMAGGFTMLAYGLMSWLNIPIMAIFGFIRGIGVPPQNLIPEIIGAFIGRFVLQKRFGQQRFLQMAPVLVAGYMTGAGLIALIGVGVTLIAKAISAAPF